MREVAASPSACAFEPSARGQVAREQGQPRRTDAGRLISTDRRRRGPKFGHTPHS